MAEAAPSRGITQYTAETANVARIAACIIGPCTSMLRDLLSQQVMPIKLRALVCRQNVKLNYEQRKQVYTGGVPDYNIFDWSLLYLLLRTNGICTPGITPPANGWGNPPNSHLETTTGDDIERIRLLKNEVCSNIKKPELTTQKLNDHLITITDVANRMGVRLGRGGKYMKEIEETVLELLDNKRSFNIDKLEGWEKNSTSQQSLLQQQQQTSTAQLGQTVLQSSVAWNTSTTTTMHHGFPPGPTGYPPNYLRFSGSHYQRAIARFIPPPPMQQQQQHPGTPKQISEVGDDYKRSAIISDKDLKEFDKLHVDSGDKGWAGAQGEIDYSFIPPPPMQQQQQHPGTPKQISEGGDDYKRSAIISDKDLIEFDKLHVDSGDKGWAGAQGEIDYSFIPPPPMQQQQQHPGTPKQISEGGDDYKRSAIISDKDLKEFDKLHVDSGDKGWAGAQGEIDYSFIPPPPMQQQQQHPGTPKQISEGGDDYKRSAIISDKDLKEFDKLHVDSGDKGWAGAQGEIDYSFIPPPPMQQQQQHPGTPKQISEGGDDYKRSAIISDKDLKEFDKLHVDSGDKGWAGAQGEIDYSFIPPPPMQQHQQHPGTPKQISEGGDDYKRSAIISDKDLKEFDKLHVDSGDKGWAGAQGEIDYSSDKKGKERRPAKASDEKEENKNDKAKGEHGPIQSREAWVQGSVPPHYRGRPRPPHHRKDRRFMFPPPPRVYPPPYRVLLSPNKRTQFLQQPIAQPPPSVSMAQAKSPIQSSISGSSPAPRPRKSDKGDDEDEHWRQKRLQQNEDMSTVIERAAEQLWEAVEKLKTQQLRQLDERSREKKDDKSPAQPPPPVSMAQAKIPIHSSTSGSSPAPSLRKSDRGDDEDEHWRQKTLQRNRQMFTVNERARKRREDEKKMETKRKAVAEQLRQLDERSGKKKDDKAGKGSSRAIPPRFQKHQPEHPVAVRQPPPQQQPGSPQPLPSLMGLETAPPPSLLLMQTFYRQEHFKLRFCHCELKLELVGIVDSLLKGYDKIMLRCEEYMTPVEVQQCKRYGFSEICDILEQKGKFGIGNYDILRQIFKDINEPAIKVIDKYQRQIDELIQKDEATQKNTVAQTDDLKDKKIRKWTGGENSHGHVVTRATLGFEESPSNSIIKAASIGSVELVELLIKHDADVNKCDNDGNSPLYAASSNGHVEIVELLIKHNADVNICDNDGKSSLYVSSRYGYDNIVNMLIEYCADVNKCNSVGETPLYVSSRYGHVEVVKCLIKYNADVNKSNKKGWSSLHVSSCNGYDTIVKILLQSTTNINNGSYDDNSPLYLSSIKGHDKVVKVLIENGADINKSNNVGETPLYVSARLNHAKVVAMLIANEGDVNKSRNDGCSPLYIASRCGHTNIVARLIMSGADVNKCKNSGMSPLHESSSYLHNEVSRFLLANGADVNALNKNGCSPLYLLARLGYKEVVQLLKENRTAPKISDNMESGLLFSAIHHQQEAIELLIENGANVNMCDNNGESPLFVSSSSGNDKIVMLLINNGANTDKYNNKGWSPLYVSSLKNHYNVVKLLIDNDADVNKCSNAGESALYIASRYGYDKVAHYLISHGADVNKCNNGGESPLFISGRYGHQCVVKLLIDHEADINKCNNNGKSPLYISASSGHDTIVQLLIENGADINKRTNDGETPYSVSRKNHHHKIFRLLVDKDFENYKGSIIERRKRLMREMEETEKRRADAEAQSRAQVRVPDRDRTSTCSVS